MDSIIHRNTNLRLTNVKDALLFALKTESLAAVVQVFDDLGSEALRKVVESVRVIEPGNEFVVRGTLLLKDSSFYKCSNFQTCVDQYNLYMAL